MDEVPIDASILDVDNPAVIAHIQLLENIISRLANNSASCKTWCLAIVSALLGLAGAAHLPAIGLLATVAVVISWFLDSGYLAQERAYRALYTRTIDKIHTKAYTAYDTYNVGATADCNSVLAAVGSWSISPVYLGLLFVLGIISIATWSNMIGVVKP